MKKPKKKINKLNLWALIISGIAIMGILCLLIGVGLIISLLQNKPKLNVSDFEQIESSVIYDQKEEEIANLGEVIRQNIEYNELPNCVVDAFVAVEDSRYFQHNGFDIPRFTKAILENLASMSFGQGGSTFTMQLVKNTYFTNDETGEQASRSGVSGIRRKVQEISLALELEHKKSKQDIFESYVNKLNFGGDSNIRGIQKAAQYYFAKDISQCNLVEGALLAGVINAPNYYNPFYNLEAAQLRTEEVLYLMNYHGYITDQEYKLAKSIRVEDLLTDPYKVTGNYEGVPYQAYIDAVVAETIELTGLDPYTTTMHIYTYMNTDIQEAMDDIQGQSIDDYLAFPDDYIECASVCVENSTGHVVGILGGRNYAAGGQLLLNHATEQYKQPGSSIKPILDYALAFENLGWATDHVLTDRPMYMDSSKKNLVYNDSGTYIGDVTIREAVGRSINTCAIQTLQKVLDTKNYEYVVNYTTSLGYDFTLDRFNVQYGVGGSTCEVTPFQHAGAYAGLMNYGNYNTPHTVARIEFTNGKSPFTPVYESKQVISEAAAYITTDILKSNVNSYGGSYDVVKSDNYQVYAKTGTTDWGNSGSDYGIPSGAVKDTWLVAATSEYTTATWVGYEKAVKGQPSYVTYDYYYTRPQAKIAHTILDACYQYGKNKPKELTKPNGVTSITHIIGTWPYASTNVDGFNLDESLITTGLIKSDSVKLVKLDAPEIEKISSADAKLDENGMISLKWAKYPKDDYMSNVSDTRDTSLKSSSGETIVSASGKVLFDYSWVYGPVQYVADIKADGKTIKQIVSQDDTKATVVEIPAGAKVSVDLYYKYENSSSHSNVVTIDAGTSQTKFVLPNTTDEQELKEFVEKYSKFITFEKASESQDSASYVFYNTKTPSVLSHAGDIITITDADDAFILKYTPAKVTNYSIEYSNIREDDKITGITFTASENVDEWKLDGDPCASNTKSVSFYIDDLENGDYEITCYFENGNYVSRTFTVTDDSIIVD